MTELGKCLHCGKPLQIKKIPKPFMHGWVGCPFCGVYKRWNNDPEGAVRIMNKHIGLTPEEAMAAVETVFIMSPEERCDMARALCV